MSVRARVALLVVFATVLSSGGTGCSSRRRAAAQEHGARSAKEPAIVPVQATAPEPDAPSSCFRRASARTALLDTQNAILCMGAWSAAPVDCYLAARDRLMITDAQRIVLCRCADSIAPVECHAMLGRESPLTDSDIERLCAPTFALGLLENCRPAGE